MNVKRRVFKKFKLSKKIEMLKVDPKTANLATLLNFDVIEQNGCRNIFAVELCYLPHRDVNPYLFLKLA